MGLIRGRRWRLMENLIRGLPATSHYQAAIACDEEAIAAWLDANPGPQPRPKPGWTEFGMVEQLLTAIGERLEELVAATAGSDVTLKPWPRPEGARARIERRKSIQRHLNLVDEVKQAQARWGVEEGCGGES